MEIGYRSPEFLILSTLRKAFSFYRKGHKGFREVRKGLNINWINLRSLRFLSVLCGFSLFRSGYKYSIIIFFILLEKMLYLCTLWLKQTEEQVFFEKIQYFLIYE